MLELTTNGRTTERKTTESQVGVVEHPLDMMLFIALINVCLAFLLNIMTIN